MNLESIILQVQTKLGVESDGKAGIETWTAIRDRIVGKQPPEPSETAPMPDKPSVPIAPEDAVDARSEGIIATLNPRVAPYVRALIHRADDRGITIKAISGTRTYAEQNALYNQRPQVTKARGGYSNHNFGIAFDIGVFQDGKYLGESPLYKVVGAMGLDIGLDWGGNWKSFVDEPHYQLRPKWAKDMSEGAMLAELRRRKDNGIDPFA